MADQDRNGTEAPTQRRREEARKDGQVVLSPDVSTASTLLAGALFLMWFGSSIGDHISSSFRTWMRDVPPSDWTNFHSSMGARWFASELVMTCGGLLIVIMFIGLLINFLQVGFVISFRPMEMDWGKLSPAKGWERLMSSESLIRGGLGAAKVLLLVCVSCIILWFRRHELSVTNFSSVGELLIYGWNLGLTICVSLAIVMVCIAAIDYLARWLRNEEKLKMTRDEIKREMKEEFGDPTVKAAVRKMRQEAMKAMSVSDVSKATVVLTNPTHLAIAIQYEQGIMSAPKVIAKGAGDFAKNIVSIARKNSIPVMERKPLARALFKSVKVGQDIPPEFFRAIAEILAQIYRVRQSAA